ncbi:MAG: ATP-binding protein [Oscillospiraceae bacterium]|nr:ATP-binding protein [Oscillospiraceae bacterium]
MIERKEYLDKLLGHKDKRLIKVITGVRRCGKSTLLELFQDRLRADGVGDDRIISINFEAYENEYLLDLDTLHAYVLDHAAKEKKTYVFLDEIQKVVGFQKVVDSLYLRTNLDIYITGSNSDLLSGELASLLTGRYVEIGMLPLSFAEFVSVNGGMTELQNKYRLYLESSSFPAAIEFDNNRKLILDYLDGLYNSIVTNDIVKRKRITDTMMLRSVLCFALDNVGGHLSTKSISDYMNSNGRKIDVKTVEKYIDALVESFLLYRVHRYNIKGKQQLKTLEKYYTVDIGMRYAILGNERADVGHILENVVYLELIRRGYKVSVGKWDEFEVDFIAVNPNERLYIQVAASVRDPKTLERELRSLQKINDHYPKYILTLDDDPDSDYNGIRRTNALQWLVR